MRRFELWRNTDVNGMSGTGIVAEGVEFSDGTAAMRWKTDIATTSVAPNVNHFNYIHGHEGATRVVWLDNEEFNRGDEVMIRNHYAPQYGKTGKFHSSDSYELYYVTFDEDSKRRVAFNREDLSLVEPVLTDPSKV